VKTRKLLVLFVVLSVALGVNAAKIVDYYHEDNYTDAVSLYSGSVVAVGQSFTGNGTTLDSVKFYLRKSGLPIGNATVKIYSHTGTYGTSSKPGDSLAVSAEFDVSTLTTSNQLIKFSFTGDNRIILSANTYYIVAIHYAGGDASNFLRVGRDITSPTHAGNFCYLVGVIWSADGTRDTIFYVYGSREGLLGYQLQWYDKLHEYFLRMTQ